MALCRNVFMSEWLYVVMSLCRNGVVSRYVMSGDDFGAVDTTYDPPSGSNK